MKTTVEQESSIRKSIEVVVDADVIQQHINDAYREIGKKAKLKGFRPGKVPRQVLEQHYAHDALNQALRSLVDATYPEALEQEKVQPLSYPEIEILRFDPAKELAYRARFDVKPMLGEIKGYKGLKLKPAKTTVTAKDVEERLKAYQQHHAKLVPIDPPRPPKAGDVVTFDYVALREGKSFEGNEVKDYRAELGSGVLLSEFEAALEQMALGEKKQIDVTLPNDFADKNFAGKKMNYTVTLKDVKLKKLPAIDDDFAKDLGFDDLKAFRAKVKADLEAAKKQEARSLLHREIVEKLVELNEFDLPESMIVNEVEAMYEQLRQNLAQQGQNPEALGLTPEVFREKNQAEAALRVKGMLLFEAVWSAENITVTEAERAAKMAELAQQLNQSLEAVKGYYDENPARLGHLDAMILQDKTLDFIEGQAKIE